VEQQWLLTEDLVSNLLTSLDTSLYGGKHRLQSYLYLNTALTFVAVAFNICNAVVDVLLGCESVGILP
jgi:hypothetical protein